MQKDKKGNTAFHSASNTNAPESLDLMLKCGGDVNCQNEFGSTPLHKSCKFGTINCAKILIKHSIFCRL